MSNTAFQDLLGLRLPIVQGAFGGGLSTVDLVSAVSNGGGLGSFGAHLLQPEEIVSLATRLRAKTSKPFALNLWVGDPDPGAVRVDRDEFERAWSIVAPFYREYGLERPEMPGRYLPAPDRQFEGLLEARPPVFSFIFGIPPAAVLAECRRRGIVTFGTATTLAEALVLDAAGVDAILATGFEAGGHRPSFLAPAEDSLTGALALTRVIAAKVDRPVVAAGGIVDAQGVRAALALGAGAAQLGTAFLACTESGAADVHRRALFSPRAGHTVLTRAYSGRLARGIPNRAVLEMAKHRVPAFPLQSWFMSKLKAASVARGEEDFLSLYAGQGTPLLKHRSAAALMESLESGIAS